MADVLPLNASWQPPIAPLSPGRQSGDERSMKCHIHPIITIIMLNIDPNADPSIRRTGTQRNMVASGRR